MKTRSTILTLLLMAGFTMFAQKQVEQQGYVRSIGRPDNKYGERLGGATIRVSGQHNDVRSNDNGDFTITFDDATVGVTSYSLSRVRLAGYEVNEKEVIGRQYAVSAKVPHEIVMVSLAVKQALEDSITARIDRRYKTEYAKLEREKEQLGEEYHARLQKLFDEYDKRDQLISEMVERYANTDYAKLDSTAAKINAYIETGELEKADSIIRAMDVAKMESEYKMVREDNDRLRAELQKGEKAQENLYQNLYTAYNGKYEIFAQQFMNDSAAFYLEKIVELDTTNVENLLRAGEFISKYIADFDKAMKLYQSALRNSIDLYGENSNKTSLCYSYVASLYSELSEFEEAIKYYKKVLDIRLQISGEVSVDVENAYTNMSAVYYKISDFDESMKYALKVLSIDSALRITDNFSIYTTIGSLYMEKYEYTKALKYLWQSIDIIKSNYGDVDSNIAGNYDFICWIYRKLNDYDKGIEYANKSLDIRMQIFGENHPEVAVSYGNIGAFYSKLGDYDEALKYHLQAVKIFNSFYGEYNSYVSNVYANIGTMYSEFDDAKALEYYSKSLDVRLQIYGENNIDVADSYANIANVYINLGYGTGNQDYFLEGIRCYEKAIDIALRQLGETRRSLVLWYRNLAFSYYRVGNSESAFECYSDALRIALSLYGQNHIETGITFANLATLYEFQGEWIKAAENFYFAKKSFVFNFGIDDSKVNSVNAHMFNCYTSLAATEPSYSDTISDFLSTKLFVAQFPVDSTSKSELQGELYLLQLDDWNMEAVGNVFDLNKSLNGKKKNVVLYKDGKVLNRKLDKKTEFDIILKEVGKDEHDEVIEAWKKTVKK